MSVPVAAKVARRITRGLMAAGADRPETAQPLDDLSLPGRRALQRLLHQGVVREAGGRYWLDGAVYARWSAARLRRVLVILLVVAAAMVAMTVLGFLRE